MTGTYSSSFPTPTGIPADPALTSHGTRQSEELAKFLITIDPPLDAVFSSPYYRCLQTIEPYVKLRQDASQGPKSFLIRPEHGIREFFGSAPFSHPEPASAEVLKEMFPTYDKTYVSGVRPSTSGETYAQLYERVAKAVNEIVEQCDREGLKSVILCTHAAVVIILGRILTGVIPERVEEVDFKAYTCGLSVFKRTDKELTLSGTYDIQYISKDLLICLLTYLDRCGNAFGCVRRIATAAFFKAERKEDGKF